MSNKVAVIGAGMTRFVRRAQESSAELTSKAVQMALEDAGLTIDDIDCVCLGTAPDAFDGVHMKGEHLLAGAGGKNKPYMRHFVGGGTGVFSPIHGWMHVASGKFRNCLVVTEEKMSPCVPHPAGAFLTIFDHTTEQPLELTLIHIFAIEMARFMHKYDWTEEQIAEISVLCKRNALNHPAAQIAQEITVKDVMDSKLLSWPVKRLDISPTSDAACAIVLANETVARTHCKAPVYIDGVGFRLDTAYWNTRDLAFPGYVAMAAKDAYEMAGVTNPADQIDVFEPYDPFDYKALHHMNALLLDKTGRRVKDFLQSGAFNRDSSHPLCPSGGALGVGNPIAATGLMKIAELYFQLSGQAGGRQVAKNAYRGVAQAWGDLMQVGTVVVMSSEGSTPRTTRWSEMKPEDLAGTGVKDITAVPHTTYTPDLRYAWDNGQALTTYLDGFKHGKIRASQCSKCARMMIPARSFCELCNLHNVSDYFNVGDTGTVETFTLSHVDWDSSELPNGQVNIFAVITIDGASEEMGICHRLGDVDPKDVKFGMKVKAVWKPEDQRDGSVTDIVYFRPLQKGESDEVTIEQIKPVEMDVSTAQSFPGKIPMSYRYTAGIAGARFYNDLEAGKLSGTYCEECDAVHLPATEFCETHMVPLSPEKDAKAIDPKSGIIAAVTEVYEDRSGHELAEPIALAQVVFPGAMGSVFGKIKLATDEQADVGTPVELMKSKKNGGPSEIWFKPIG